MDIEMTESARGRLTSILTSFTSDNGPQTTTIPRVFSLQKESNTINPKESNFNGKCRVFDVECVHVVNKIFLRNYFYRIN
jgi:hypothetical protein